MVILVQDLCGIFIHLVQVLRLLHIFKYYDKISIINWEVAHYIMKESEKSFDATQYKNQFQKEKYDRIIVNVPKGQKEVITSYAKEHSYNSLNSFVVDAINEKMKN